MSTYRIECAVGALADAEAFFLDRGTYGLEGTGFLAARQVAGDWWQAHRFVAPDQVASRVRGGCWVQVTDEGKRQMAATLDTGELLLARIHSHPGEAFHSDTDDANPALTFRGALSIVAPFFGLGLRRGLDACAIYRLTPDGWTELGEQRAQWVTFRA